MEKIFYNSVSLTHQSNYKKKAALIEKHSSWKKVWENLPSSSKKSIDPELEWNKLEKKGVKLIMKEDPEFPPLLREIPWPPFGLYCLGNFTAPTLSLSIVGTRKATDAGRDLSKKFAASLAKFSITITSGLAFGIDAKSHEGALESDGLTLAVIAGGLDYIYPKTNEKLAQRIIALGGSILSEYPLGSPYLPHHFIERNRIISGISQGILIIEAPENSGSLATARFALDQNREIFVIPGPATHPNFKGSHSLIRQGANLVTQPEEILEVLAPELIEQKEKNIPETTLDSIAEKIILQTLKTSSQPLNIDKIIEVTKLDAKQTNQALTFLQIKNIIRETEDGYSL